MSCSPPSILGARDQAASADTSFPPTAQPEHTLLLAQECLLRAHPLCPLLLAVHSIGFARSASRGRLLNPSSIMSLHAEHRCLLVLSRTLYPLPYHPLWPRTEGQRHPWTQWPHPGLLRMRIILFSLAEPELVCSPCINTGMSVLCRAPHSRDCSLCPLCCIYQQWLHASFIAQLFNTNLFHSAVFLTSLKSLALRSAFASCAPLFMPSFRKSHHLFHNYLCLLCFTLRACFFSHNSQAGLAILRETPCPKHFPSPTVSPSMLSWAC